MDLGASRCVCVFYTLSCSFMFHSRFCFIFFYILCARLFDTKVTKKGEEANKMLGFGYTVFVVDRAGGSPTTKTNPDERQNVNLQAKISHLCCVSYYLVSNFRTLLMLKLEMEDRSGAIIITIQNNTI